MTGLVAQQSPVNPAMTVRFGHIPDGQTIQFAWSIQKNRGDVAFIHGVPFHVFQLPPRRVQLAGTGYHTTSGHHRRQQVPTRCIT